MQETVPTEPSGSPSPPAAEPRVATTPVKEPVRPVGEAEDQGVSDSPEEVLAEDRQLIRVRRDDLVTSISINGTIAFPNTGKVILETQGTLGRLAVEEGQAVTEGQALAYMDRATEIALEGALAQAQVDATMASETLADTLTPHSPLETAQAEARVAEVREALWTAEEKLLFLLRPTDHEIAWPSRSVPTPF